MAVCEKGRIVQGIIWMIQKARSDFAEPIERMGKDSEFVERYMHDHLPELFPLEGEINLLKLALETNEKSDIEVLNLLILCHQHERIPILFPLFFGNMDLPTVDQFLNMMNI